MQLELREHLLAKVIAKFGWTKIEAEIALNEFVKFLQLALEAPPSFIPVVQEIDEIWHLSILQTEAYQELCYALSPGNFLHHKSDTYERYSSGIESSMLLDESLSWTVNYLIRFGDLSVDTIKYWTFPKFLVSEHGWTIDEVNSLRELNPNEINKIIETGLKDE